MRIRHLAKIGMAWALQQTRLLRLLRLALASRRAAILTYHRIDDDGDPFFPSLPTAVFEAQVRLVRRHFAMDTFAGVASWLASGGEGRPRAAITIDDGYPGTATHAFRVLDALGVPATLFLATSPPETGEPLWLDRLRGLLKHAQVPDIRVAELGLGALSLADREQRLQALRTIAPALKPRRPEVIEGILDSLADRCGVPPPGRHEVLRWDQVAQMRDGGLEVGAHTHRHYILSTLSARQARDEIVASMELIESRLGVAARTFAYPNGDEGDYTEATTRILMECGIRAACTTRAALAGPSDAMLELPRLPTAVRSSALFHCSLVGLSRWDAPPLRATASSSVSPRS